MTIEILGAILCGLFYTVLSLDDEKKEDEVTRCVGYLVPVSSYSAARRDEENHRQWYSVGEDTYL